MINIFSTRIGEEEIDAIKRVAKTNWLGYGEETKLFEKELGDKFGSPNFLVINDCTAGLFMSMKILGIGPGDEVIIPSIHFVGAVNAIVDCGATPVFADCTLYDFNINPVEIARLRTNRTKAIMLLHYGGHPSMCKSLEESIRGLYVIEDNANSIASKFNEKYCGTLGDIGCYSFDSMKIMTTCDGGAMYLKTKDLYDKAALLRQYGSLSASGMAVAQNQKSKWWEFQQAYVSGRFISNDILSSIGRVQLRKLDSFISRRHEIWNYYQKCFKPIEQLVCPPDLPINFGIEGSYYLYWLRCKDRNELAQYLFTKGIYCTFRYYPLHLIKFYNYHGIPLTNCDVVNDTALNLPIHQYLTDSEVEFIVECVKKFFEKKGS